MVLCDLDKRVLVGIRAYFGEDEYSGVKTKYVNERREELKAKQSASMCDLWIESINFGDAEICLEIEKAIYYSIKCEWTENAECFFDYDKKTVLLKDASLGLDIFKGGASA